MKTTAPKQSELSVELGGCASLNGMTCAIDKGAGLAVWLSADSQTDISFFVGRQPLEPRGSSSYIAGGRRFVLDPPSGARSLEIRAGLKQNQQSILQIQLAQPERAPSIAKAKELRARGQLQAALQVLENSVDKLSAADRAHAQSLRGRLIRQQGDFDRAVVELEEAMKSHLAGGRTSEAMFDFSALMHTLIYNAGRLSAAFELAQSFPPPPARDAYSLCSYHYAHAVLGLRRGDIRSALSAGRLATRHGKRGKFDRCLSSARQVIASAAMASGRAELALELWDEWYDSLDDDTPTWQRVLLMNQKGWAMLTAAEAGRADPSSAIELFEQALSLSKSDEQNLQSAPKSLHYTQMILRINLALAELLQGNLKQAEKWLDEYDNGDSRLRNKYQTWRDELRARIALARGETDRAGAMFEAIQDHAHETADFEAEWRATWGLARVAESSGDIESALAAYDAADALASSAVLLVPIGQGRASFFAKRRWVFSDHLSLLLSQRDIRKALQLVRRERNRVLSALHREDRFRYLPEEIQKRHDRLISEYWEIKARLDESIEQNWERDAKQRELAGQQHRAMAERIAQLLDEAFQLVVDENQGISKLPPLPTDQTVLVYWPLADQWLGFAVFGEKVVVKELGAVDPGAGGEVLADQLLEPFRPLMQRDRAIRILASEAVSSIDFHALPWDNSLLLAFAPVVYGIDLPRLPAAKSEETRCKRVVIIADTRGDLPRALDEGKLVQRRFESMSPAWCTTAIFQDAATMENVRTAMMGAELFYFTGHGAFKGQGGWESALTLARGTDLTVRDILTMKSPPQNVVLGACESGVADNKREVLGPSIAAAFLAAGSRLVVAASGRLEDEAAIDLAKRLMDETEQAAFDLSDSMRRAQLSLLGPEGSGDGSSVRVWVR